MTKPKVKRTTKVAEAKAPEQTEIIIEQNVPIPQVSTGRSKYPLEDMKPGDSFLVPCTDAKAQALKASIRGSAQRLTKKYKGGVKFVVLVRPEEKGVRCWRPAEEVQTCVPPNRTMMGVPNPGPDECMTQSQQQVRDPGGEPIDDAPALKVFDE